MDTHQDDQEVLQQSQDQQVEDNMAENDERENDISDLPTEDSNMQVSPVLIVDCDNVQSATPGSVEIIWNVEDTVGYSWKDEILRYKDRVVISPTSTLKTRILEELNSSPTAGHAGFQKTYAHTRHSFFWTGMKTDILTFVAKCDVC